MATKLKALGIDSLIYGKDGEYALEQGMERVYPISGNNNIHCCFNHVKDDVKRKLGTLGISDTNTIVTSVLGYERGNQRIAELVDCTKDEFDKKYEALAKTWRSDFPAYVGEWQ